MLKTLLAGALATILTVSLAACSELGLETGACHHGKTGEELKEVVDVNGEVFTVQKQEGEFFGTTLAVCAVSIDAVVRLEEGWGSDDYFLFHPDTGAEVKVRSPYRGLREIDYPTYEWY